MTPHLFVTGLARNEQPTTPAFYANLFVTGLARNEQTSNEET